MRRQALSARPAHRCVVLLLQLLALVLLLLAASSDGIRPAPPPRPAAGVGADAQMAHEEEEQHGKATAALQVAHMQGRRRSDGDGDGDGNGGGGGDFLLQGDLVHATGSRLPDCSHACGPCSPCNRVMVSFKCSVAEPCPMVYRCMCKGKCYPVPSS